MFAFKTISVFIFNRLSKLAHKRGAIDGDPFQLPYPRKPLPPPVHSEELSETLAEQPVVNETTSTTEPTKSTEKVAIIDENDLLDNEYELKQFLLRFEEDLLKLLEPTDQGIKVPRPIPYPNYLKRPPDIPVAHTHASVLRRLYNEEKIDRTLPLEVRGTRKYPKKPPVPKYSEPAILELRQKSIKVQDPERNRGDTLEPTTVPNKTANKLVHVQHQSSHRKKQRVKDADCKI